jgi:hypothetical protein
VKDKIDNVKAKIQDKEEKGSWSRPTLARRLVSCQLAASPTSSPLEGSPQQVSASHEKIGSDWRVGPDAQRRIMARAPPPTHMEEWFPVPHKYNSWRPCKQLTPAGALMLF